ncbi:hypothetical protein QYM36_017557, partial [Artemia franciscana]
MLTQLYKTLVWPVIEYRNISYIGDCTTMERVQFRANKMMPGLKGKPYKDHIKSFKLPSLSYR